MPHKIKQQKIAQVSIEFLIIISVALIMFLFLFNTAYQKSEQYAVHSAKLYARQLIDNLNQQIYSVYLAGDGTSKLIELPDTLRNNLDYSINFYPDYKIVELNTTILTKQIKESSILPTKKIECQLNNINYQISVTNNNGVLIIT